MFSTNRRSFGAVSLGGALAVASSVGKAQTGGRLVIGNWGGDSQRILDETVVTPYLRSKGVETVFDAAAEPPRKVKILAERALPRGTLDIAGMSDPGGYELWKNGAVADIDYARIANVDTIIAAVKKPYLFPNSLARASSCTIPRRLRSPDVLF